MSVKLSSFYNPNQVEQSAFIFPLLQSKAVLTNPSQTKMAKEAGQNGYTWNKDFQNETALLSNACYKKTAKKHKTCGICGKKQYCHWYRNPPGWISERDNACYQKTIKNNFLKTHWICSKERKERKERYGRWYQNFLSGVSGRCHQCFLNINKLSKTDSTNKNKISKETQDKGTRQYSNPSNVSKKYSRKRKSDEQIPSFLLPDLIQSFH